MSYHNNFSNKNKKPQNTHGQSFTYQPYEPTLFLISQYG